MRTILHFLVVLWTTVLRTRVGAFVARPQHAFASRSRRRLRRPRHRLDMAISPTPTGLPETTPLPLHSFAGLVEAVLKERFGEENIQRVIESWRYLQLEYEHYEFVGSHQTPPITTTDGESSACHQQAHSYVPGLQARQFWNVDNFEWAQFLKRKYPQIKAEFSRVTADMDTLAKQGNNIWAGALTQDASSYGEGWRTLVLMDRGTWDPVNANLFPVASKAIHESGAPVVEAFYASMKAHTDIKLHTDNTNFVVTSHLALDIPESGSNKCRLTIGDETRQWINGDVLMFDTSILHAAVNESDETRYILMLRLWHPDLSDQERQALQFIYDAIQIPELVSNNPEERSRADQLVLSMRTFPDLQRTAAGFGGGGARVQAKKKKKLN